MKPRTKIMFLGIDAGDKCLLRRWAGDGTLPVLRSLLARGLVAETTSVQGLYEGATWPSFYTGLNPARHGFHRLTQIQPGTYDFHPCRPGEFIKAEPFWTQLSKAGKRVAVLDVPLSGLSRGLNGIQVIEWASHDGIYGFHTWPTQLKRDVLKRFGRHPVNPCCDSYGRSPRDFCAFRDHLLEGVHKKCALTKHYLKHNDWDFFAQVFTEAHCAGHQCWHLHDPAHPNHDPDVVRITGDPMREVYRAIDTALGSLLAEVDDHTLVFLFATHRLAHNIGASFLLEDILEKLGYLTKNPRAANPQPQGLVRRVVHFAKEGCKELPAPMQNLLKPVLFPLYHSARRLATGNHLPQLASRFDLEHSACFPHENGNLVSGIRLNLVGREPNGLVRAGRDLEEVCRGITEALLDIVEKKTGKPVVKRVLRTADFLQGEYVGHLPDLLVEWGEDYRVGTSALSGGASHLLRVASDKIGVLEGAYSYCRTGDHRPEGLLIVFGPGVKPGHIERTISIMDFAPTFLNLFGVSHPGLDGTPLSEVS
jgi:predicted AlkP superfamily phosphohydrolase/phosphomutase